MEGVEDMRTMNREMDTDMATARMRNHDAPNAYANYGLPRPDPAAIAPSPGEVQRRTMAEWRVVQDEEDFVPTEAEKDAAALAAARMITNLDQRKAAKEPMRQRRLMDMVEEEEERPDLNAYFNDFPYEISDPERIKMCRAYASYLVSLQPPPPPRATKKSKK